MLNIAIIDDEILIGELLKESLQGSERKISVYSSGVEALEFINERNQPDIILMDLNIPDISGVELTYILKNRCPKLEIIVQTVIEDSDMILKAIKAGASGYMLKATMNDELLNAIDVVKKGGSFLTGKIAKKVLQEFHKPISKEAEESGIRIFELTKREEEILHELIKGTLYRDIATKFGLSFHTVSSHIRKIYMKMQVNSRSDAVAKAVAGMNKNEDR